VGGIIWRCANSNRSGSKWRRPVDSDTVCPSCAEEVTDDGVECQWGSYWEHYKCAGISIICCR